MSNRVSNFTKVIYFCKRRVIPSIGPLSVLFTMQDIPCKNSWKLQFYLYGAKKHQYFLNEYNELKVSTKKLYTGMSMIPPYHSRLTFHSYAKDYNNSNSFVFYGELYGHVLPPFPTTPDASEVVQTVSSCQNSPPLTLTAPVFITSPNYPNNYNNSLNCQWVIYVDNRNNSKAQNYFVFIYSNKF